MCEQCKECEVKLNVEKRMVEVLREKNRELEAVNRNQKEMIQNLLDRLGRNNVNYPPSRPYNPIKPYGGGWT
jgi:hypothetical protein